MSQISQQYYSTLDQVDRALHQPGKLNDISTLVENKLGVKRIYVAQGIFGLFVFYMVFGYFAQLICNFVGFIYPAYVSIKALESSSKEDDTRWLTYWVVFSAFSVAEFFSDFIFSWFPFYWLAKVLFLIWCYAPMKDNGSTYVYSRIIRPLFLKNTNKIDNFNKKVEAKINEVKDAFTKKD
ncbi:hypothetical protein RDWZM_004791 [Blomia tropicalis]|uniref:Receptor expression-enhancing protein n=1 Tax=Blomia tropicalis TaxID=40697 RepID=A0A9Q0RLP8_BLOTA|nr:Receptor expression-enhancing protein 5 [Blomia tropicalis]KAJ6218979.1 hypothetical protein RDWZM_004791 [Blomia tropicalis]